MNKKTYPKIGEKCTVVFPYTGTKYPYTVIGYAKGAVLIQECRLIFYGVQYFDTIADEIEPDDCGRVEKLHWCPKYGLWKMNKYATAYFGKWGHQPYTD